MKKYTSGHIILPTKLQILPTNILSQMAGRSFLGLNKTGDTLAAKDSVLNTSAEPRFPDDSVLQVVELDSPLDPTQPGSRFLFLRNFYFRLAQRIFLDSDYPKCVLIGNPGISKSFFHWYVFPFSFNSIFFFKKKVHLIYIFFVFFFCNFLL